MEAKKYIVITGASSGIGQACALRFAKEGYQLILTARRADRLESLRSKLEEMHGTEVRTLAFDVRSEAQTAEAFASLHASVSANIVGLVNNAGLAVGRSPIDEGLTEDWDRMVDTNVKGLLYVTKHVVPYMRANRRGHIFNIASIAGKEVYPDGNVYCATKHAVDALSQAMRTDLLPHRIKVTNIAPGAVNTEFSLVRFKGDRQLAEQVYDGFEPLHAEDIADAIWYAFSVPEHVNLNDLVIMPAAQASATRFIKNS